MDDNFHHKPDKIYYSMGEVSEMFDVKPSLIRFWETKFDILKPHKNKKGNRLFTPTDVDNLKIIYHLVKEKGMTLNGAMLKMKENSSEFGRDMEVVERLQKIKSVLLEIRQELNDVEPDQQNVVADTQTTLAHKPQTPEEHDVVVPFIQQTLF